MATNSKAQADHRHTRRLTALKRHQRCRLADTRRAAITESTR